MDAVIREYGISCWFTDTGPALEHLESGDVDPDRKGITEIRYVEGLYRLWDDIRKAHPGLLISNCCGGGLRIDLETVSRSILTFRTDGAQITMNLWRDPIKTTIQNQMLNLGLNRYIPVAGQAQKGADPYNLRSGANGCITFCDDVRKDGYPRDLLKQGIKEVRRIRKYWYGNFYPLSGLTPNFQEIIGLNYTPVSNDRLKNGRTADYKDWSIVQYHRPENEDGVLIALRRHESPFPTYICALHEIDDDAQYDVYVYDSYSRCMRTVMNGSQLRNIRLDIEDCPGSLLVEYSKIGKSYIGTNGK